MRYTSSSTVLLIGHSPSREQQLAFLPLPNRAGSLADGHHTLEPLPGQARELQAVHGNPANLPERAEADPRSVCAGYDAVQLGTRSPGRLQAVPPGIRCSYAAGWWPTSR